MSDEGRDDGRPAPPRHRTLSTVFRELGKGRHERISIATVDEALHGRSFGPFLIAFSFPNMLPFPPGSSMVLGLPLLFIGWQMVAQRTEVWLPGVLRRRSISLARYRRLLNRALPWLRRTEALMRPRRWPFAIGAGNRTLGLYVLLLALLIVIPVPFANWLPAVACFCAGVALTAKDGVWLGASAILGMISLALFMAIVVITFMAVEAVVE